MKQFEFSSSRFEDDVMKYLKSLSEEEGKVCRGFFKSLTRYNFNEGSLITYKSRDNTIKVITLKCPKGIINKLREISSKPYLEFLNFKRKPYSIYKLSDVLKENGYLDFEDKKEISVFNQKNESMVNVDIGFLRPDYSEVFKFLKEDNESIVEVDAVQGFINIYCPNCEAKEAEKIKSSIKKKLEVRVQNE